MKLSEYPVDELWNRKLFSVYVEDLAELIEGITLPPPYFSCLLVCDAVGVPDDLIKSVANQLLAAGVVYQCTWGPGCSWVHTLFDIIHVERQLQGYAEYDELVTTGHQHETLDEAIWFLLYCAYPPTLDLSSTLVITVGNTEWDKQVQDTLSDLSRLM